MQRERLPVALRYESDALVAAASEEILEGEVGELESDSADDARLSPSGREFNLVAALGGEGIGDIDGARLLVRHDVALYVLCEEFGVKLVHVRQFAYGAFDALHGEEVAGLGAELAPYDIVEHALIARDAHAVEGGLLAFANAHFEVDAIAFHIDFHGVETVEDIAIVVVLLPDGIFVFREALVAQADVIDIALLHAEGMIEGIGGIDRIAHPADIAEIIFPSFIEVEIDIHVLLIVGHHGVGLDEGIAIAP